MQVGREVYSLKFFDAKLIKYEMLPGLGLAATEKAGPSTKRMWPSLASYHDKYLFVTGGMGLVSVEYYDISMDKWEQGPDLNIPRQSHSSCALGDKLYVCCGSDYAEPLRSIERLDV